MFTVDKEFRWIQNDRSRLQRLSWWGILLQPLRNLLAPGSIPINIHMINIISDKCGCTVEAMPGTRLAQLQTERLHSTGNKWHSTRTS